MKVYKFLQGTVSLTFNIIMSWGIIIGMLCLREEKNVLVCGKWKI